MRSLIKLCPAEGEELKSLDAAQLKDALWIEAVAPCHEEVEKLHDEPGIDLQERML